MSIPGAYIHKGIEFLENIVKGAIAENSSETQTVKHRPAIPDDMLCRYLRAMFPDSVIAEMRLQDITVMSMLSTVSRKTEFKVFATVTETGNRVIETVSIRDEDIEILDFDQVGLLILRELCDAIARMDQRT